MAKILTDIGKVLSIYIILILISCSGEDHMSISEKNQSKLIDDILNHKNFKLYLHPEVDGRVPVKIVTNGLISSKLDISIFGKPVEIYERDVPPPFIAIDRLELSEGTILFELSYEIEGVIAVGSAIRVNDGYEIKDIEVSES